MAVAPQPGPAEGPYPDLFRRYVQRGAQAALADVAAAGPALPAEQREQGLHTLDFALGLPEAWPQARDLLIALAPRLEQAGLRQDSIPRLQRGIAQCQAGGDLAGQAQLELHLGLVHLALGRLDAARDLFAASADHCQAAGDRHGQARALNRWAYVDRLQQRLESAAQRVGEAMRLATPDESEHTYGRFVLGGLALDHGDWPAALAHFQEALAGWRRHGDPLMAARSLTNLGAALRGAGRPDEAIARYQEALPLLAALGDTANEATTRMNLGNVYWQQGQPQQALAQYVQAEAALRQADDHLRLAKVNLNLGLVLRDLGQWPRAEQAIAAAIELYRSLGDRRGAANALDALAEVYLDQGRADAALPLLRQALAELEGLEGRPGYASLLAEIERDLAQARQGR